MGATGNCKFMGITVGSKRRLARQGEFVPTLLAWMLVWWRLGTCLHWESWKCHPAYRKDFHRPSLQAVCYIFWRKPIHWRSDMQQLWIGLATLTVPKMRRGFQPALRCDSVPVSPLRVPDRKQSRSRCSDAKPPGDQSFEWRWCRPTENKIQLHKHS